MTVKGGTSQACASCKYQRRKCGADCALAPYFPPDQPKKFQNVHRLFGVSNINKILSKLKHPIQKDEAMRTIIIESETREKNPVHGCYGIIAELCYRINQVELELEAVNAQLNLYRNHYQLHIHTSSTSHLQLGNNNASSSSAAATSTTINNNSAVPFFQQRPFNNVPGTGIAVGPQHHHSFSNDSNNNNNNNNNGGYSSSPVGYIDPKDGIMINSLWVQQHQNNSDSNDNSLAIQSQFINAGAQPFPIQRQEEIADLQQDYDEIPASFLDPNVDDRLSIINSKDACESSSETSTKDMKQAAEYVAENELKSAAACFSLTSVN